MLRACAEGGITAVVAEATGSRAVHAVWTDEVACLRLLVTARVEVEARDGGTGANGKGVLQNLINETLRQGAVARSVSVQFLRSLHVASLSGALAAFSFKQTFSSEISTPPCPTPAGSSVTVVCLQVFKFGSS